MTFERTLEEYRSISEWWTSIREPRIAEREGFNGTLLAM